MRIRTGSTCFSMLVVVLMVLISGRLFALEPPRHCAITRGAWCIMDGYYQITYSGVDNQPLNQWVISQDRWSDEPAVILESVGCRDAVADENEIVETNREVEWNGQLWREVVVRLRGDGKCELRLLAPTFERVELDTAASELSGSIAVCYLDQRCEANSIDAETYRSFRSMR